jgi:hypothetical protein
MVTGSVGAEKNRFTQVTVFSSFRFLPINLEKEKRGATKVTILSSVAMNLVILLVLKNDTEYNLHSCDRKFSHSQKS